MEAPMLISDILATKGRKVATVLPSDSVKHAVQLLAERRIGAVPVMNGETVPGGMKARERVT